MVRRWGVISYARVRQGQGTKAMWSIDRKTERASRVGLSGLSQILGRSCLHQPDLVYDTSIVDLVGLPKSSKRLYSLSRITYCEHAKVFSGAYGVLVHQYK